MNKKELQKSAKLKKTDVIMQMKYEYEHGFDWLVPVCPWGM